MLEYNEANANAPWRPALGEYDKRISDIKTFNYRIKSIYNPQFRNNTVLLKIIDKNGFEYMTSKSFMFSPYGTSGTDYSLVIEDPVNKIATLYDPNGEPMPEASIEWSLYPSGNIDSDISEKTGYRVVRAEASIPWLEDSSVKIEALAPVSWGSNRYHYQGPVTFIYNN
jgi:hypothetical protein